MIEKFFHILYENARIVFTQRIYNMDGNNREDEEKR